MSRRVALDTFVLAAVVALGELYFVTRKFPVYNPHPRSRITELRVIADQHIGIVQGQHGASFVRLPRHLRLPPSSIPEDVVRQMNRDLSRLPVKALAEFFLYFACLSFAWFAARVAWSRTPAHLWRGTVAGLAVAFSTFIIQAPTAWGYDSTAFSTWVGPGAYSFSYPAMRLTFIPGVGIAQRFTFEALQVGAWKIINSIARPLTYIDIWISPPTTWWGAFTVASVVHGAVATFLVIAASLAARWAESNSRLQRTSARRED